ncbi:polysaccharide deacetylase family protein [Ramlibacter tataouinensis]|uniref:GlcNAc deacetylase, Carbohydrate Esterase Family 4-like protein n=1 Tax=Ramlibacter tataouinensis (strain ATCC BAA-407 / DSM 14655 / LMG 21543 / TTB310) TaxID=365046 RepID=F5Y4K6_RAMTT|nr:polysaccharide deacetylase family protein [Ramlibacter tataouinensis]AEG91324.1 GlcNAc deacetylase, Carbohydrate Esterase Family 4-like protein [Ramlibacter tataouinensis TTB310]
MAAELHAPVAPRWRPSPLVAGSLLLHGLALLLAAWRPQWWPQLLAVLVADHVLLTACGLWPRSHWLGPNLVRLPAAAAARGEVAITIDDGPDPEVTPAVLDILDAHGARATFFCIGTQARRHPQLCQEIVRRGHAIGNHSQHHRHHFSFLGPRGLRRELQAAQDTLAGITGRRPRFFRAPAGLRNPLLDPVLPGLGLRLASWTRRGFDTRTHDAGLLLRRLTHELAAGDILLLHDGHAARGADGRPAILAVLPRLLERLAAAGLKPVTLDHAIPPTTP